MSDIFISYASEDKGRVQALARALERKGWSVWWDRRIPVGRSFDEVIEEALDASKAVVVVWTQASVKSQWVKNEAREGLRRRVLFPVMMLEEVKIPLEFRDVQAGHLMDWNLGQEHPGFDQFLDDLAGVIGAPPNAAVQPPSVTQSEEPVPAPASPTVELEIEPLPESVAEVESEPERQKPKRKSSSAMAGDVGQDSSVESASSTEVVDVSGDDRESVRSSEDRPSEATGPAPSTESFPYLSIGLGILVVIGALVYVVVFSQGPSPVKRDVVSYQPTVQPPTTRPEEITPTPAPEPIRQLVPATTQEKPTAKQRVGPAKTITGKDGAPMVLIPDGEFWMGSPDGEGDKDEHPRHQVALVAFYMDKFEVTVSRYAEFMESTNRSSPEYWDQVDRHKHGALPIVGVDWQDAGAYCRWAGKRLPTEAEWEKAARGKDGRTYPWGNEPPTARLANFGKAFTANVYDERLAPVDSYAAGKSPYGLHHMAGNVWEWTADLYDEAYYRNSQERSPKGPSSGEYRVVRGGSWLSGPHLVRSATRYWNTPTSRLANIGFRCAQDRPN